MADKTVIIKLDVQEAGAEAQIVSLNNKLSKLTEGEKDYELVLKKIAIQEDRLSKIQAKRATIQGNVLKETKNTTKQLNKQSDATGSATAATMELSRVVSDAPYGIRGMANNITQLVSQLGTASTKAGGLTGALKLMGKQLLGPLGIVFAITVAVSALDFFYGANKKAEKGTNDFNDSVSKSGSNLKILKRALEDGTISTEEANRAVKKANKEYVGLNLQLDENNKLTEASVGFIDDKINAIERLAKAQAIQSLIETQYSIIAKARHELDSELSQKGLNLKDLDIRKEEERVALEGKTGARRRKIQRDFLTQNEKVANGLVTSFRDIETKGNDAITSLMSQLSEADLVDELFKGKGKVKPKPIAVGLELEAKSVEDAVSGSQELVNGKPVLIPVAFNPIIPEYDEVAEFIKHYKTLMSGLTDFIDGEFERELTIERNKTNAINAELNNRLNNENLSKDQRASIQNQIAQNDEKLRVKQEAIARKQFKVTKAFNIAMTIADTYMAAQKAYLSQMLIPSPTAPIRAKIAAAVAVASGLAKVAAISRTTFQSTAPSTPTNIGGGGGGSGGGGDARAEPSFNIVGRSGDSLLINAIQAQFGKPLKAYVVSREVTNQQQLDGIIVNQAST